MTEQATQGRNEPVKDLPVGVISMSTIRRDDMIYVDKTDMVYKLAKSTNYVFLSRPRRFGKTVLISTFESLFKHGLQDFRGLAIEKLWNEDKASNKDCTVLRLDFSGFCNFTTLEQFRTAFYSVLSVFMRTNPVPDDGTLNLFGDDVLMSFGNWLRIRNEIAPGKLVLLIDEYDAPLNHCLHNSTLFTSILTLLSDFYFKIKSNADALRFLFITGVCRYRHTTIFSGFNFLNDITLNNTYGTLVGYTEDELRKYFSPYIRHAAEVLETSFEECIARMKENYDGFCFDQLASTHVFAPWSVLKFLAEPQMGFQNYWYESGGAPSLVMNYLKGHALKDPSSYGRDQLISISKLNAAKELKDIDDVSLLTQAGYLSIKSLSDSGALIVNYPNRELAASMARLYADSAIDESSQSKFAELFTQFNQDYFVDGLNDFFGKLSYETFKFTDEASVQSALYLCLMSAGLNAAIEVRNAFGRSDLEVKTSNRYFVIELKFARDNNDGDKLLAQAEQQIRDKHYGEFTRKDLPHVNIALVFSEQKRAFTHCKCFSIGE